MPGPSPFEAPHPRHGILSFWHTGGSLDVLNRLIVDLNSDSPQFQVYCAKRLCFCRPKALGSQPKRLPFPAMSRVVIGSDFSLTQVPRRIRL